jgi:DNA replication and repair protein RecF
VRIGRLEVSNFRNYRRLVLDLPEGLSLVVGGNGQGKTNLVDAIHILATGRSLRTGPEASWVRFEASAAEGFARLYSTLVSVDGPSDIEVVVARTRPDDGEDSGVRRRVRVSGVRRRVTELPGQLLAVSFSPIDLEFWTGAPTGRRRWLDVAAAQLDMAYMGTLADYEAILSRRNALLRRIQAGQASSRELGFWDDRIAVPAVALGMARQHYLERIASGVVQAFTAMGESLPFEIAYRPSSDALDPARYSAKLYADRDSDVGRGTSGTGPHRDDVGGLLKGRPIAHVGSRGQLRVAALSLKLAQHDLAYADRGESPVLLLDDMGAELDLDHRRRLMERIPRDAQVLATAADPELFGDSSARSATRFRVIDGEIVEFDG